MGEPTISLRDLLVQAVNGYPVTGDQAWALVREWDALVEVRFAGQRLIHRAGVHAGDASDLRAFVAALARFTEEGTRLKVVEPSDDPCPSCGDVYFTCDDPSRCERAKASS